MNVDTTTQKQLLDAVREKGRAMREGLLAAFADAHLGSAQPDDAQFVTWVQQHVMAVGPDGQPNPTYDPYWAPALRYDDGTVGKEITRRFQKLTGVDLLALPVPPPPAPAGPVPQTGVM